MKTTIEIDAYDALTILQAIEHDIKTTLRKENDISYKRLKIRDLINAHHTIISQCKELQQL